MNRRNVLGLAGASALAARPVGGALGAAAPAVGLNISLWFGDPHALTPDQLLDLLVANDLVPSVLRFGLHWPDMEPVPGVRAAWYDATLRHLLERASSLGVRHCVVHAGLQPPSWARLAGPSGLADHYAEHVSWIARELRPESVELGNEPDLAGIPPEDYARLATKAYAAAKTAAADGGREIRVLAGSLAGANVSYFEQVLRAAGGIPVGDALSIHLYPPGSPGACPYGSRWGFDCAIADLRRAFPRLGIVVTETGWPAPVGGAVFPEAVSPSRQAEWYLRAGEIASREGVPELIFYEAIDPHPRSERFARAFAERERHFGVFGSDHVPKPAAEALRRLV